jgi:hypothetical protein
LKEYLRVLFAPIEAAVIERGQRRGRLDSHALPKLLTSPEPLPAARKLPLEPEIPQVRWTLLVDISSSMLQDQQGREHSTTPHKAISGAKLEYAGQAAMVFAEALEGLLGHTYESAVFTSRGAFPAASGAAPTASLVVKATHDAWTHSNSC